jgi:hypothetical protein
MWEEEDLPGLEIKPVTPENNGWTKGYASILSHSLPRLQIAWNATLHVTLHPAGAFLGWLW